MRGREKLSVKCSCRIDLAMVKFVHKLIIKKIKKSVLFASFTIRLLFDVMPLCFHGLLGLFQRSSQSEYVTNATKLSFSFDSSSPKLKVSFCLFNF